MRKLIIVVTELEDWANLYPSDDVVTVHEYLASAPNGVDPNQVRIYIFDPNNQRWEIPAEWLPPPVPQAGIPVIFTPCSIRYVPAGLSLAMLPAGEIWSVVTLSPSTASARAPTIERSGGFFYFFDEFGSVHVWNNNVKLHSPQRETSHFPAPSGRRFAKNAKYHIFYLDDVKFHI